MSTSLTTLEAIEVGHSFSTNGQTWTRTEDGFRSDPTGITLPVTALTTLTVTSDMVRPPAEPEAIEVGQHYNFSDAQHYVVLADAGDDHWIAGWLSPVHAPLADRHSPSGLLVTGVTSGDLRRQGQITQVADNRRLIGNMMVAAYRETTAAAEAPAPPQDLINGMTPEVHDELRVALRDYAASNHIQHDGDTAALFDQFGLGEPVEDEEIEVTITVNGSTAIELDTDDMRRLAPSGVDPEGHDDFEIDWSYEIARTFEVTYGRCACDHVDRDLIDGIFRDADMPVSRFEYEMSCENC